MQLAKPVRELFKNVGVNQEIFQLKEGSDLREQDKMAGQMGFTNIAKTIACQRRRRSLVGVTILPRSEAS